MEKHLQSLLFVFYYQNYAGHFHFQCVFIKRFCNETFVVKSSCLDIDLKLVSFAFLPVCSLSLKESTCETWKNVFNVTSKALFVREKIIILEFQIFKFNDVIKCLSIKQKKTFYLKTWKVIIVLIKFGQFMSYYKRKKNSTETAT